MTQAEPTGAPSAPRDDEAKRKVVNRLRRAHGQLAAVINAVEQEVPCRDVVQQLAAVSKALDRAGFTIISSAMKGCVADADGVNPGDGITIDELEKLFLSLS